MELASRHSHIQRYDATEKMLSRCTCPVMRETLGTLMSQHESIPGSDRLSLTQPLLSPISEEPSHFTRGVDSHKPMKAEDDNLWQRD